MMPVGRHLKIITQCSPGSLRHGHCEAYTGAKKHSMPHDMLEILAPPDVIQYLKTHCVLF